MPSCVNLRGVCAGPASAPRRDPRSWPRPLGAALTGAPALTCLSSTAAAVVGGEIKNIKLSDYKGK